MKLLNTRIITLLVLLLSLGSHYVYAEHTLEFKGNSNKTEFIGESSEAYLTIFDESNSGIERIYRKNLIDDSTKSIQIENYKGGDVSKDGAQVVWLEQTLNEDSIPSSHLKLYNFENSTEIETVLSSDQSYISQPIFISNEKILYRAGYEFTRGTTLADTFTVIVYTQMIVYDITNNSQETVYVINSEQTENQWYSIEDIKLSGDESTILFLQQDSIYTCSNCVLSTNDSLNIFKLDTAVADVIVSDLLAPNYAITHNAEYILYTNYSDEAQVKKAKLSDKSTETIDLSQYLNATYTLSNRVFSIAISDDASILAFSGLADFNDTRQFSFNEDYLDGADRQRDFTGVFVLNIDENKAVLANKINNSQFIPAQLVSLSRNGDKVRLKTTDTYEKYISYDIDYDFHADYAVTGAWYNPEQSGQGLTINFTPDPNDSKGGAIVTWYTVDNQGNPLWLIMQAYFNGNILSGDAIQVTGSQFNNYNPDETNRINWGTLTLEFFDCKTANLSYQPTIDGYQAGNLALTRLSYQSGVGCL